MFIIILAQHKQCYTEKNKLTTSTVLSVRDVIQNEIVECGIKYNFSLFCPHRPHVLLVYASLATINLNKIYFKQTIRLKHTLKKTCNTVVRPPRIHTPAQESSLNAPKGSCFLNHQMV